MCVMQVAAAIPWGLTAFLLQGLIILLVLTVEVTKDSKD